MGTFCYYKSSGEISDVRDFPEIIHPEEMMGDGEVGYLTCDIGLQNTHKDYCVVNGLITKKPDKPLDFMEFDYSKQSWFDPRSLEKAKIDKWVSVKKERDKKYRDPFLFNGSFFQPDIQTIMAKAQVAQLDLANFSQSWVTADNHTVTLNGDDMIGMGLALDARNSDIFAKSQQLRALIEAAITNEQVDAVTWSSV